MIAVDTSALMVMVLREPRAAECMKAIEADDAVLISAGTMADALVVAGTPNIGREMAALIDRLASEIVPVTQAAAQRAGQAYADWGKGIHPAGLNFADCFAADCFAYEVAKANSCRLRYLGNDFSKTDTESVP
jgi:ribonuclease VapC